MPKTEIGSLAVKLTAEASEFNRAVDAAGVKLHTLAHQGGSGFNVQSLTGAIPGLSGGAMLGPTGAAIAGMTALATAAGLAWHEIVNVGEEFRKTAKRAAELGIGTESLVSLRVLARDRSEEAETAVQHLERTIGEAAKGSSEARAKFEALGLSWRDLEGRSPIAAFTQVNDAIAKSGDAYTKAAAAREMYGRQGQQLMRVIEQGSKGMDAAAQVAAYKGLFPNEDFTRAAEGYHHAKVGLDQSLEGFKNTVVSSNVGQKSLMFATGGVSALSALIDATLIKHEDPALAAKRDHDEQAAAAAGALAAAEQRAAAAGASVAAAARITAEHLDAQTKALDMLPWQAAAYTAQVERGAKFTADQLKALVDMTDAQERLKKAQEESAHAKALGEQVLTPLERVNTEMSKLDSLLAEGRISSDTFGRAMLKTAAEFHKLTAGDTGAQHALTMGSQADRSFGLQLDRDKAAAAENPWTRFEADRRQQLANDQRLGQQVAGILSEIQAARTRQEQLEGPGL